MKKYNLKYEQIVKDIPKPDELDKMHEPPMLGLIYKAVFYCLSILLDIRPDGNKYNNDLDIAIPKLTIIQNLNDSIVK